MDNDPVKTRKRVKQLFKTPEGKKVLEFLTECYIKPSCLNDNHYITHYQLGQKELIQMLVDWTNDDDSITTNLEDYDYE